METFCFFIEDDRYSVPTIEFVAVGDVGNAMELAADRLRGSAHYLSIAATQDDEPVFKLSRDMN